MYSDQVLHCLGCDKDFVFSAGEQEFFSAKGLINKPKRCPNCRVLIRLQRDGKDVQVASDVPCADCGTLTKVPFQPKGYRPVYCNCCFKARKLAEIAEQSEPSCATRDHILVVPAP